MFESVYSMAGEVRIPEEKREEFNSYVLEILKKCGMRKTENIMLAGRSITVVTPAIPKEDGIVEFDYSIFEKEKREVSTYNTNTCQLKLSEPGLNEFGMSICMIMALQESYTGGNCYMMEYGKPHEYMPAYLRLLQGLFNRRFGLPGRCKMWDMLLFFKENEKLETLTGEKLIEDYWNSYGKLDSAQFWAVVSTILQETEMVHCEEVLERSAIKKASYSDIRKYLYTLLKRMHQTDNNYLNRFLKDLLDADIERRKIMSEGEDDYGILAEISLYVLPAVIVEIYAYIKNMNFWDTWDSLHINGYKEILNEEETDEKEEKIIKVPFYKAIMRETQDEFLEFWNGDNLTLSDSMKNSIEKWQRDFLNTEIPMGFEMEKYLVDILVELKEIWHCRYVDKEFVEEFMNHKEEKPYKKAIILFKNILDEGTEYFPELTKRQAKEWVIKRYRDKFDKISMSAYQSLMMNRDKRAELFGF